MAETERRKLTQEELDKIFPIKIEKNICSMCGKEYDQPALITQFGVIIARACPDCVNKYDIAEKSKEKYRKESNKAEWLEAIGVKEEHEKATLDNYKPGTESQKEALSACKLIDSGNILKLVLLGSNGVGKTHLASALVKKHNGLLITAYEMFATYRGCFSPKAKESELDVIRRFSTLPLLAIDEFGRTKGSEAEDNFLSAIIDNRHANNLPTLILSNLIRKRDCVFYTSDNKCCSNCQRNNCLESRLTKDVISRLRENSRVVLIEGNDYRRGQ